MRLRPPILASLSLLLLSWQNAGAQLAPADDFFHIGAQCYITNNIPTAKEQVAAGLKLYPEDTKLKKLEELLNQQQQSQDSQQDQKDQQNKDQQSKKDDQKQKQDKKDQQQNQQQKDEKKQEDQKQAQDKKREQEKQQQKNPGDKPKEQKGEPQQARAAQMTPQQAQRLLDTQKGTEQVLWFKPEGKPEDPNHPVKDW